MCVYNCYDYDDKTIQNNSRLRVKYDMKILLKVVCCILKIEKFLKARRLGKCMKCGFYLGDYD